MNIAVATLVCNLSNPKAFYYMYKYFGMVEHSKNWLFFAVVPERERGREGGGERERGRGRELSNYVAFYAFYL